MRVADILDVLDRCAADFTFPMLDNGYVYLAATRLSLHRSDDDWGLVIEVFGFSPRAGLPDTTVHTFGSRLNEPRTVFPIDDGPWIDEDQVAEDATEVVLRGRSVRLPPVADYARHGITLADPPRVRVEEACRWLAAVHRDDVLATPLERRISLRPDMREILVLDEWNHPNVVDEEEPPSTSEAFQQLALVLETGDVSRYRPTVPANTHWENWPDGGTL